MEQLHKDASCGTLREQESDICFTSCSLGEEWERSVVFFLNKAYILVTGFQMMWRYVCAALHMAELQWDDGERQLVATAFPSCLSCFLLSTLTGPWSLESHQGTGLKGSMSHSGLGWAHRSDMLQYIPPLTFTGSGMKNLPETTQDRCPFSFPGHTCSYAV